MPIGVRPPRRKKAPLPGLATRRREGRARPLPRWHTIPPPLSPPTSLVPRERQRLGAGQRREVLPPRPGKSAWSCWAECGAASGVGQTLVLIQQVRERFELHPRSRTCPILPGGTGGVRRKNERRLVLYVCNVCVIRHPQIGSLWTELDLRRVRKWAGKCRTGIERRLRGKARPNGSSFPTTLKFIHDRAACKTLLDSVPRKNYKDSIYGVAWLMVRF